LGSSTSFTVVFGDTTLLLLLLVVVVAVAVVVLGEVTLLVCLAALTFF